MTFEIVVGLFIITNTCLQLFWFFWSKSVEQRKHFTDSQANNAEIDFINTIEEYLKLKVQNEITIRERDKEWEEFMAPGKCGGKSPGKSPGVSLEIDSLDSSEHPDTANAHLERNEKGHYDHTKVDGALDGLFDK